MSAADLSVAMLKNSLEANGLATYGTKEEMLQRLLAGGGKKKPGPKPKGDVPKKKKPTSALKPPSAVDSEEAAFMLAERPRVVSMGITDFAEQTAELKRRWAQVKKSKAKTSAKPAAAVPGSIIKLPSQLDATQAASCGLTLVGTEPGPAGMQFVYAPASAKKETTVSGAKRKMPEVAAMPADEDEEEDDDDDDDDEMQWACDVAAMRLVKKAKKEHLAALCGDFGVPVSGTKQELAELLAEQMHYETDDEEDDEE